MESEERQITKRDIEKIYALISRKDVLNLTNMNDREKLILELIWVKRFTYQQVGDELNLTRERIRQLYEKAIRRLLYTIRIANKRYNEFAKAKEQIKSLQTENSFLQERLRLVSPNVIPDILEEQSNDVNQIKLQTLITETDLSVRAINCLTYAKINTLEELIRHSDPELLILPNLGRNTVQEIVYELRGMGLKLRDEYK